MTMEQNCQKSICCPCSPLCFLEGHPTGMSGYLGATLGLPGDNSSYLGGVWRKLRSVFEPIWSGWEVQGCSAKKWTIIQNCQKSMCSPYRPVRFFEGYPTAITGHLGATLTRLGNNSERAAPPGRIHGL